MRYLGVDYGSRKIGLALSDEGGTMGFPHAIITNTAKLVDELCALIAKENIGAVVIGESRTLSGGENPIAQDARALVLEIAVPVGVEVLVRRPDFFLLAREKRRQLTHHEGERLPAAPKPCAARGWAAASRARCAWLRH